MINILCRQTYFNEEQLYYPIDTWATHHSIEFQVRSPISTEEVKKLLVGLMFSTLQHIKNMKSTVDIDIINLHPDWFKNITVVSFKQFPCKYVSTDEIKFYPPYLYHPDLHSYYLSVVLEPQVRECILKSASIMLRFNLANADDAEIRDAITGYLSRQSEMTDEIEACVKWIEGNASFTYTKSSKAMGYQT